MGERSPIANGRTSHCLLLPIEILTELTFRIGRPSFMFKISSNARFKKRSSWSAPHSLHQRDHAVPQVHFGLRRKRRCSRFISSLGEGLRSGQVTEPAIGIAEVERVREG